MKTWKWTHTASSMVVLGLMTLAVGCADTAPVTPPPATPVIAPSATLPAPVQPEAGSAIGGGVDVPPPAKADVTTPAETPAAAADAPKNPEEIKKEETDKPAEEKPAEEKPAEEKKAE